MELTPENVISAHLPRVVKYNLGTRTAEEDLETVKILTVLNDSGVYRLNKSVKGQYYITFEKDKFELPKKLYGNFYARKDKIIKRYNSSKGSTGAILHNLKGTGKTITMAAVANELQKQGMPSIIIGDKFHDGVFKSLLEKMPPSVIIFDEFEKVYDRPTQNRLLDMLDGASTKKHLYLLSLNNISEIADAFINRPGRIYYKMKFTGVDIDELEEWLKDGNTSKYDVLNDILRYFVKFKNDISWDILTALRNEIIDLENQDTPEKDILDTFSDMLEDLNSNVNDISIITVTADEKITDIKDPIRYITPVMTYKTRLNIEFVYIGERGHGREGGNKMNRTVFVDTEKDESIDLNILGDSYINVTCTLSKLIDLYKDGVEPPKERIES